MTREDIEALAALGEDSFRQFKADVRNEASLAAELAAFANSEGGTLLVGVADDGSLPGLEPGAVARVNQLVGNAASQHVRSPLPVRSENVLLANGRLVIAVSVPKGVDKPYFDKNGVIWLKCGADKRRVNSKEELRRLFQSVAQFHADELPTKAGPDKLDKLRFRDFLRDVYSQELPEAPGELLRLLQNMNLAGDDGMLNLAGALLFAERPEWIVPQFVVKAICYPGDDIHVSAYLDAEDFSGPLPKVFAGAMGFVTRHLRKVQAGRGVNSVGVPEIPPVVFEELIVNALLHRDYLISAPIRLFVFDGRVEIVSPGHLPNNLTVEKIRAGNSNIRNPILASFVSKGLLPYKGLGSGVKRALRDWPGIDFISDDDACLFTAIIRRAPSAGKGSEKMAAMSEKMSEKTGKGSEKTVSLEKGSEKTGKGSEKSSEKTGKGSEKTPDVAEKMSEKTLEKGSEKSSEKILALLQREPMLSTNGLASHLGIRQRVVEKIIAVLRRKGRLRRVGPDKGGHWEVLRP